MTARANTSVLENLSLKLVLPKAIRTRTQMKIHLNLPVCRTDAQKNLAPLIFTRVEVRSGQGMARNAGWNLGNACGRYREVVQMERATIYLIWISWTCGSPCHLHYFIFIDADYSDTPSPSDITMRYSHPAQSAKGSSQPQLRVLRAQGTRKQQVPLFPTRK